MNKNLIKRYSSQITEEQIYEFATKNNIVITKQETHSVLNVLHNDIDKLLANPKIYLESIRHEFSDETYTKILELYDKYSIYLI